MGAFLLKPFIWATSAAFLVAACGPPPPEADAGPPPPVFRASVLGEVPLTDFVPDVGAAPTVDDGDGELEWLEVGPVGVRGGRSSTIQIDVPPDMTSLTLHAWGHDDVALLVDEAVAPSGRALVSPAQTLSNAQRTFSAARGFPSQFFSPVRQLARGSLATTRFPLRDDVTLESGTWSVRIRTAVLSELTQFPPPPVDRPIHVALLGRTRTPEVPRKLALALHFTGAGEMTAATAPDDDDLSAALATVRETFAAIDIEVEIASFHDVDSRFVVVELADGTCSGGDMDALMKASSGAPGTLSLFFIDRFQCVSGAIDVGPFLGGLTSGIPASVYVADSPRGGIAVSTSVVVGDSHFGELLAHEIGHGLGLFHTIENTRPPAPVVADLISDTSDDEAEAQSNLMFHTLNDNMRLSSGQGRVVRRHPGVRE